MIDKNDFLKIAIEQSGNYFDNSERHVRNILETDSFLLKDGKTEYKILLPATIKEDRILSASNELRTLFAEATGITLELVMDDDMSYHSDGRYFSIGYTKLAKEANLPCGYEDLHQQGYYLKSFRNSILFVGHTEFGALYAVYDFLADILGFDHFSPGSYALDKEVRDIHLKNYNVKEIPDIGAFSRNYGTLLKEKYPEVLNRYRMSEREDTLLTVNGLSTVHNMMLFLKYEEYSIKHPKWFTEWKKRDPKYSFEETFCFTAHGDRQEYELLVEGVTNKIKQEFKNGAKGEILVFGQGDGSPACDCPACKALKEKYKSDTAACIIFLGDVLDCIYSWFETVEGKCYKRNFRFVILAYLAYELAPVKYDKNSKEFIINGGLKVHPKIGFIIAPIKYDYGALSTTSQNRSYYQNIVAWASATHLSAFYIYDFNTRYYFIPNETLASKQELYRLMAGLECIFLYDQGQWTNRGIPTGFSLLKLYVSTKLRWNVNCDVDQLIDRFLKGAYGPAYEVMKSLYWDYRDFWKRIRERAEQGSVNPRHVNYCSALIGSRDIWETSFDMLTEWLQRYDKAFDAIKELKEQDSERYNIIYRDITAERVCVNYILLLLFSNRYSTIKLQKMRIQFKEDTTLIHAENLKEGYENWDGRRQSVKEILSDWGL